MITSKTGQSIKRYIWFRAGVLTSSCLLGGVFTFISQYNLAQAQTPLPPVPDNIRESQGYVGQPIEQNLPTYDYQAPQQQNYQQNYQFSQNYQGYTVYVLDDYNQYLSLVRRLERSAPVRFVQGRRAIQAGIFRNPENARRRLGELQQLGIPSQSIFVTDGNQARNPSPNPNPFPGGFAPRPRDEDSYFVVIPASSSQLLNIQQKIRREARNNLGGIEVRIRNNPRGPHVAVGPFPKRLSAEQWNGYIQSLGFGNARVFYGR